MKVSLGGMMEKVLMAGVILESLRKHKGLIVTAKKEQDVPLPDIRGITLFGRKGNLSGSVFTPTEE